MLPQLPSIAVSIRTVSRTGCQPVGHGYASKTLVGRLTTNRGLPEKSKKGWTMGIGSNWFGKHNRSAKCRARYRFTHNAGWV